MKPSAWDLSDLEQKHPEKKIEDLAKRLESYKGRLDSLSVKQFMALLKEFEELRVISMKLAGLAHLQVSENSSDQEASADIARIMVFLTNIENRLLFFTLWWKDLPDKKAKRFQDASGSYHYYLDQIRKTKPYTLSEKEEQILNIIHASGLSGLNAAYNILTTQFEFQYKGRNVSQNRLLVLVKDPDPKVRQDAYTALLSKYAEFKDVIGEIYRSLVNVWHEENVSVRRYRDPVSVRNVMNDIPDGVVDTLLAVCRKNERVFQHYFELKRKELKLRKMRRFDLYAPVGAERKAIPYGEAVKLVLATFRRFSPVFEERAQQLIRKKHVHSRIQKNKNTGAFCSGISTTITPYVLLNYTGTARDVSTLAHELGHAVHFSLSGTQTEFTFEASLPLAETASIFGEMLLFEELKRKYPKEARMLAFTKLDETYASIIRQAGFVAFEKKAHGMIAQGKTMQEVSDAYIALLREQLGKDIIVDDLFRQEWCYIPHIFHSPFYCYAYAFGNLLVLALYGMYKEKGPGFSKEIIALLEKGGSGSPVQLTRDIGVDIADPHFWQKGFDIVGKMVDDLERD